MLLACKALHAITMSGESPEQVALRKLVSKDQTDALDLIDSLRSFGAGSYVSLPQIIVCGDQSSGKSSVLQAISRIAFPTKSGLCTRFPTELILRKAKKPAVSVSIVPDQQRSDEERRILSRFNRTVDASKDISTLVPDLIFEFSEVVDQSSSGTSFARDILRVEVSGPDRPQLTIVDLPGLIHSATGQQSSGDVALVKSMVQHYMRERRSIILAVVSAVNDPATQIVLSLARQFDEDGHRSLGIVTKPDALTPGSRRESDIINLARNRDVIFTHGWHVLRNIDTDKGEATLAERDEQERKFFLEGSWATLPRDRLGIEALRERLSKVLLQQITDELPDLMGEIEASASTCRDTLKQLGKARSSTKEQRKYLVRISQRFQIIIKGAVEGTYNETFFGTPQSKKGDVKRLRGVIQNLHESFSEAMSTKGHTREIIQDDSKKESDSEGPRKITRKKFLSHITKLLKTDRGRELPGTFNPMLVRILFTEQSDPWGELVKEHIENLMEATEDFLQLVLKEIADDVTGQELFDRLFDPVLDEIKTKIEEKVNQLLSWRQDGHPVTYDEEFVTTVQDVRSARMKDRTIKVLREYLGITYAGSSGKVVYVSTQRPVDLEKLSDSLNKDSDSLNEHHAASDALDYMLAYYKVKKLVIRAIILLMDDLACNETIR